MATLSELKQLPNRIFVKLLLSFWLCSSLLIALVVLLPLLGDKETQPIGHKLQELLNDMGYKVEQGLDRSIEKTSKRFSSLRYHENGRFYLLDAEGKRLDNKPASRQLRQFILIAEEAGMPVRHQFDNKLFFGPLFIEHQGQQYQLYGSFLGRAPKPWFMFLLDHPLLTLIFAISLSGIICALMAWHLGKPLAQLKQSADALAQGKLDQRINAATCHRRDEIGQLAQAFNRMGDAISQTLNAQQRLLSDVSHELRTPLTRLQLSLALARKKGITGKEMERIDYEAQQLELLISELLEFSRMKGQAIQNKAALDLNETLSQVLDDAEFEAEQQGKRLNIEIPDEVYVPHHGRSLARATENVLRNAIRYAEQEISIRIQWQGQQLAICIEDDGTGVAEAELEAIFQPFYRPSDARERQTGGWGLGLAITAAAIHNHQGVIHTSNRQPQGLKVEFLLPLPPAN